MPRRLSGWPAAALSGVLLALCFPKPDLGWLAWVALIPLFLSLGEAPEPPLRKRFSAGAWRGFVFGFCFFIVLLYWIYPICRLGHVAPPLAALATCALAVVLALVFAAFGAGAALFSNRLPAWVFPAAAAALWTALELFRERVMGFPWDLLGYSQWRHVPLLAVTAFTGVHGLSFLIVWVNASLATGARRRSWLLPAAPLACVLAAFLYGARVDAQPTAGTGIEVAALQGNVDQYKKWDDAYVQQIEDTYAALAQQARGADLVVWPESSLPGWLEDPLIKLWTIETVQSTKAWNVVGAVLRGPGDTVLNAAVLVDPAGLFVKIYAKRHLVPFGEYVPLQGLLGRWAPILTELGGVSAGTDATPLPYPKAAVGATVCYEVIFPDEVREEVEDGAALLVNLTNDGWYLDTAGPYQHMAMNALRAAENRRPLVRAANTGISAFFDADGRLLRTLPIGSRGVLRGDVIVDPAAPLTFFTRHGEIFAWLCAAVSAISLIACVV